MQQQIKRYETKTGKLQRRLMGFGKYDKLKKKYTKIITFDYTLNNNKVVVCLGYTDFDVYDLMQRFEEYAKEIFKRLIGAGICNNFDDIDWHIIDNYKFEINRVIHVSTVF